LYRGVKDFKRGYQPRSILIRDENGDLLADSHISNRWKNYFSQLLKVHIVSDVRQREINTADSLALSRLKIVIAKLNRYKSPGSDQIPA
jgi:hypothetical protein